MKNHLILFLVLGFIFSCNKPQSVTSKTAPKPTVSSIPAKIEKDKSAENVSPKSEKHEVSKPESETGKTEKIYSYGDLSIQLKQQVADDSTFYCKSSLLVRKNQKIVDSISFDISPAGGNYGISRPIRLNKHLVFTKHGDYDGRALIVNAQGKIFNIPGGLHYFEEEANLLFTKHESDLQGVAIFNLNKDSLILEILDIPTEPIKFYKEEGRYFFLGIDIESNNKEIWEIEREEERIMQVDFQESDFNSAANMKRLRSDVVNCICEK